MTALSSIKHRNNLPDLLPENAVGVELGVASGKFFEVLAESGRFRLLVGVDAWAGDRGHGEDEMIKAVNRANRFDFTVISKNTFEEAAKEEEGNTFDFIYIDGYAHTGQERGETLEQWWPKLKVGGIFAGHDYCGCWMPTVIQVQRFCSARRLRINYTQELCNPEKIVHPSWWVRKEKD